MVETAEFWDKMAEKYSKSPIRDEKTYNEKLEVTRRYFNPDSKVFEFGCGTGTTAINHAPYVQYILATDISTNMIAIAREKASSANIGNVEFRAETLNECAQAKGSFDVVMAHNILHLIQDPQTAINTAYELLKPGGAFVTSTACLGEGLPHWRILLFLGKIFGKVPFVNVLKRKQLEQYFSNAGFELDLEWHRHKVSAFIILKKPIA
ncbi:MAG: class I SAM-dependent methyltransferase [Pseudohongiellaceae bacterium]